MCSVSFLDCCFFLMIRRPPRSTRTDTFPTRRSSDLLPLPDDAPVDHPQVQELRELMQWSAGQLWCSPERHGSMRAVFKAQLDWVPLAMGAVRSTQGKTLAVMQVCGGSQSFKAVNPQRVLGSRMRVCTILNNSSVPKAYL